MGEIKCPACWNEIPSESINCPYCGFLLKTASSEQPNSLEQQKIKEVTPEFNVNQK